MSEGVPAQTINWAQIIISTVGISAIVSGATSAALNYWLTMRELKKRSKMILIQDKLDLYSSIIYHVDKMKFKYDAIAFMKGETNTQERFAFTNDEWDELVRDIDRKISDKYSLLNRKILEKWVWSKNLRVNPKSIETMRELRRMLVEEYNRIVEKHLSDLPDIVPMILPDTVGESTQTDKTNESPTK